MNANIAHHVTISQGDQRIVQKYAIQDQVIDYQYTATDIAFSLTKSFKIIRIGNGAEHLNEQTTLKIFSSILEFVGQINQNPIEMLDIICSAIENIHWNQIDENDLQSNDFRRLKPEQIANLVEQLKNGVEFNYCNNEYESMPDDKAIKITEQDKPNLESIAKWSFAVQGDAQYNPYADIAMISTIFEARSLFNFLPRIGFERADLFGTITFSELVEKLLIINSTEQLRFPKDDKDGAKKRETFKKYNYLLRLFVKSLE